MNNSPAKTFTCTSCNCQITGASVHQLLQNIGQHCSIRCGSVSTSSAPQENPKTLTCDICNDDHSLDSIIYTGCPSDHFLCTTCLQHYVQTCIADELPIHCPFRKCTPKPTPDNPRQLHFISREILEIYMRHVFSNHQWDNYWDFLALLNSSLDPCFCRCPNASCRYGEIAHSTPSETNYAKISCKKCHTDFCSYCNEAYHYKVNCRAAVECRQKWNEYKLVGRATSSQQLARNRREWEARMNDLKLDEERKARECKRCPHCNRVVYKIDGCDSMRCGSDYHGGNIQAGCQKLFNWNSAQNYVPEIAPPCPPPARSTNTVHSGYNCSACRREIVGIRFSCIHCVGVDFCEQCEEVHTATHPNTHVFRLITVPTDT